MLIILVFGISASFASDADDSIQATDDEVDETVSTGEIETLSASDTQDKTTSNVNETITSASEDSGDKLKDGTGTFTELQQLIDTSSDGTTIKLDKDYTYNTDFGKVTGVEINKTITIDGNGHKLDGASASRVLYITGSNVILKNINIINGNHATGGAMQWQGTFGQALNCNFTNSYTTTNGIVYWDGQYGNMENARFVDNRAVRTASSGYIYGTLYWVGADGKLSGSYFNHNTLLGYSGTYGGSIHWSGKNGIISDCEIYNTRLANATGAANGNHRGGGLRIIGSNVTVINSKFINNTAIRIGGTKEANAWGGAIALEADYGNIKNCIFINNSAIAMGTRDANVYGGAMEIAGKYCVVDNCIFENNYGSSANMIGYGAIYWSGASGTLSNSKFINNTGDLGGAVSFIASQCTVLNSSFIGNKAVSTNVTNGSGGAIFVSGSFTDISDCEFKNNNAEEDGGAIYFKGGSNSLTNVNVTQNTAGNNGGGICTVGNDTSLENIIASKNSATNTGGGIFILDGNSASLSNVAYNGNTASQSADISAVNVILLIKQLYISPNGKGAGLSSDDPTNWTYAYSSVENYGSIIFVGGTFNGIVNQSIEKPLTLLSTENAIIDAEGNGRIFYITAPYVTLNGLTFKNGNIDGNGGALYIIGMNDEVIHCKFENNHGTNGGAIFITYVPAAGGGGGASQTAVTETECKIEDSIFTGNTATNGGAIYINTDATPVINCTFNNNKATNGGAIYSAGTKNEIIESTFNGNNATSGSAIYQVASKAVTITENEFNRNSATGTGTVYLANSVTINALDNSFKNNNLGSGNEIASQATVYASYVYVSVGGTGNGLTKENPADWTTAYKNVATGGKIIFLEGTYQNIINQTISKNVALVGSGNVVLDAQRKGRIFKISASDVLIDGITFSNGYVNENGGALLCEGEHILINNSVFRLNEAVNGSAIFLSEGSSIELYNLKFIQNDANEGTIFFSNNTRVTVENITFENNAVETGGDFYGEDVIESPIVYYSPNGRGSGLTENDAANWETAYKNVIEGGKIIFLSGIYSDLINLPKNRL